MIIFKELRWSNAFSYGPNNYINLESNSLTQLIGKNGHGKSSIALILEEVLYNTNSKKVKKGDILNRYSTSKTYSIEVVFSKNNDTYVVQTTRGTTQNIKLLKNGEDISSHTSTGTYSLIEDILGLDFKTFTQVVHQNSASSLEFLTATDTNRKKFLIDLLNLTIYSKYSEIFKSVTKEVSDLLATEKLKLDTSEAMLSKLNKEDISIHELNVIPEPLVEEKTKLDSLRRQIATIEVLNKQITQNNKYKEILSSIVLDITAPSRIDPLDLQAELINLNSQLTHYNKIIKENGNISDKCHSCGQPINISHKLVLLEEAKIQKLKLEKHKLALDKDLSEITKNNTRAAKAEQAQLEFEKYSNLINHTLQTELLNEDDLLKECFTLEKLIKNRDDEIVSLTNKNSAISARNAKIGVIIEQKTVLEKEIQNRKEVIKIINERLNNLQILVKTFSTTGLVAYKIEGLVKDLEDLTNEYLAEMSDGRFQLYFKINSSDKLLVIIVDNGREIDIAALSAGERARVNVSTLLAIRKLMQSLSNTRINLLILDETIESLDMEGKEKLIEVLLSEVHLNTILVSHGFSHPLLNKISVIKENNISRLE